MSTTTELEGFDAFLNNTKDKVDELGPQQRSDNRSYVKLDDGGEINLEFQLGKNKAGQPIETPIIVDKPPFQEGDEPQKKIQFCVIHIDTGEEMVWEATKTAGSQALRVMTDKKTNKLVIQRFGTKKATRYTIYPWRP